MPYAPPTHRGRRPKLRRAPDTRAGAEKGNGFYNSARWRRLRRWFLQRNPLCVDPFGLHGDGHPVAAEHVDHIEPRRIRPDLEWTVANLRSLCASCHSRVTARAKRNPMPDKGIGG